MSPDDPTTPEALLAAGNYAAVAAMPVEVAGYRKHAAQALVGLSDAAYTGLQTFDSPAAHFYRGVALWMEGHDAEAVDSLRRAGTDHATRLAQLIRKPRIRVLSQLPGWRSGPSDLISHLGDEPKFEVHNISHHADDLPMRGRASIHDYYDRRLPPDFYICANIEWHLLPQNLQELPCPILGQTADYDLHIQVLQPVLQAFDELLVCDPMEWDGVRRLVSAPVSTYPKSFGLREDLAPLPERAPRELDFFASGSLFRAYHPDKVRVLFHLLQAPDLQRRFINGFLDSDQYCELLGRTKAGFSFVRRATCMPTRALEALSMGCAVAIQRGSVLGLYYGEADGVLEYGDGPELAQAVRRIKDGWGDWEGRARAGAQRVRQAFNFSRIASQYLRFATVLAARPRGPRRLVPGEQMRPRRNVMWSPGVHADQDTLDVVRQDVVAARGDGTDPIPLNDAMRELALDAGKLLRDHHPSAPQAVAGVCHAYRAVCVGSEDLVLRFNAVRFLLGHGAEEDRALALDTAHAILQGCPGDHTVDPRADIMPWDFLPEGFNYRGYLDAVTAHHQGLPAPAGPSYAEFIFASLHHAVAKHGPSEARLQHLARAYALDPGFSYYGIDYADALLARDAPQDRAEAVRVLSALCDGSMHFAAATARLAPLVAEQGAEVAGIAAALAATSHLQQAMADPAPGAAEPPGVGAAWVHAAEEPYLVSALVSAYDAERFMHGLLTDLQAQTIADRLEIIVCDSASPGNERAIVEQFQQRYPNIVYFRTEQRENSHLSLNRCIERARGRYLTLANCDDRHAPHAFERMVDALHAHPDVGLVYADYAISTTENATLESSPPSGYALLPDFDRRLLYSVCYIGPQPMWRRALHDKHGLFDTDYWKAGDYELWLRFARTERFLHIPELLGLYYLSPATNGRNTPQQMQDETERCRRAHWPAAWGPLPPAHPRGFATNAVRVKHGSLWADFLDARPFAIASEHTLRLASTMLQRIRHALTHGDRATAEECYRWIMMRIHGYPSVLTMLDREGKQVLPGSSAVRAKARANLAAQRRTPAAAVPGRAGVRLGRSA